MGELRNPEFKEPWSPLLPRLEVIASPPFVKNADAGEIYTFAMLPQAVPGWVRAIVERRRAEAASGSQSRHENHEH